MNQMQVTTTRRGGRAARRTQRAAPSEIEMRPVRGGMDSACRFRPLSDADVVRVHHAALDVLETVGIGDCLPSTVDYLTRIGCVYRDGRITFPRALVEDYLPRINRDFLLAGRDPCHDMHMQGSRLYCGTAGATVSMVDPRTGAYRNSTLNDLYDCARLVDTLDNIHFFQRTVVPREIEDFYEMDFNTLYASLAGTSKHVGTSWGGVRQLEDSLAVMHRIVGGERQWRERPFVSMSCCFTVSPLKFAADSCRCLEVGARAGMPIMLVSLGQAGATGPAALAGNVVMIVAELLAGAIYVEAVAPGNPVIIGFWPFVSDLRTGAMCCGSGEQALLTAACGQMGRYYGLISGIPAGIADSKVPDAQSGYEKALNHVVTANAGANLMYEAGGMVASLMGFSLESLAMDNDSVGAALRTVRGIEVTDDTLSVDVIREVCVGGPGHFLAHCQTMDLMERDYVYPRFGDRMSPSEWAEKDRRTALDRAIDHVDATLASHYPEHIPRAIDDEIRAKFPVRLPRERMRPNADWPRPRG
ncbi:MAG: trimethylamine methyltransferase family protein [Rhodobacteraceae bacterium]|nr:trimethylamine methyltransferase family protein [Paracoccaceae bacterium]